MYIFVVLLAPPAQVVTAAWHTLGCHDIYLCRTSCSSCPGGNRRLAAGRPDGCGAAGPGGAGGGGEGTAAAGAFRVPVVPTLSSLTCGQTIGDRVAWPPSTHGDSSPAHTASPAKIQPRYEWVCSYRYCRKAIQGCWCSVLYPQLYVPAPAFACVFPARHTVPAHIV